MPCGSPTQTVRFRWIHRPLSFSIFYFVAAKTPNMETPVHHGLPLTSGQKTELLLSTSPTPSEGSEMWRGGRAIFIAVCPAHRREKTVTGFSLGQMPAAKSLQRHAMASDSAIPAGFSRKLKSQSNAVAEGAQISRLLPEKVIFRASATPKTLPQPRPVPRRSHGIMKAGLLFSCF